jgi:hypothetical protein
MLISDIIDNLTSLYNLDNDAIKSYDSALKKISENDIYESIKRFREDHARHVDSLSHIITGLGATLPSSSGDLRGLFLGAATSLQSLIGTEGALKGLQSGEKITNKSYEDAVGQDFPPDILSVLSRNFQDERVHLDYINKALDSRIWEQQRAA